jgi:hypothetical protein
MQFLVFVACSDLACVPAATNFGSRRSARTESVPALLSLTLGSMFVVASLFTAVVKFRSLFSLAQDLVAWLRVQQSWLPFPVSKIHF